jgi:hypothetical protein
MKTVKLLGALGVVAVAAVAAFVYAGVFDVAADQPHSEALSWLLEATRERSIAVRARGEHPPALDTPEMITAGGPDYEAMCSGCHLKPGVSATEIRSGLYPKPPDLTKTLRKEPAQTFWIIKHGIKMSGMPAWGATHEDQRIWAMVAFLQQLPRLTPEQYEVLTARDDQDEMEQAIDEAAAEAPARAATAAVAHTHPGTPEGAVDAFFSALIAGDSIAAQSWLARDVLIYESGHAEHSREQYLREHLPADMKALSGVRVTPLERSGSLAGEMAWVASRVRMRSATGKPGSESVSTETMVLKRQPEGWRIQHIHWSSSKG